MQKTFFIVQLSHSHSTFLQIATILFFSETLSTWSKEAIYMILPLRHDFLFDLETNPRRRFFLDISTLNTFNYILSK